jgi:hypothetical protein
MARLVNPTRILVPPGIGDGYWVLVKLRGFLRRHGIQNPHVFVQDAGPRRSHGMWERVPFVTWGGYAEVPNRSANRMAFKRAYRTSGFPVQRRVCGFDYLLSFNGTLEAGRSLDQAMPGPLNWFEPLTKMDVTEHHAAAYRAQFGDYVAVAIWDHGFYRQWVDGFPESRIIETLQLIADAGLKVVIMGAEWDLNAIGPRVAAADQRFVNLVGETDFDQLTGLLTGASGVFGFPAGNTLLGPRFGAPSVVLWKRHFHPNFWKYACPPEPLLYQPLDIERTSPAEAAQTLVSMIAARAHGTAAAKWAFLAGAAGA